MKDCVTAANMVIRRNDKTGSKYFALHNSTSVECEAATRGTAYTPGSPCFLHSDSANRSGAVKQQRLCSAVPEPLDYFPTRPWATRALCEFLSSDEQRQQLGTMRVWEPACSFATESSNWLTEAGAQVQAALESKAAVQKAVRHAA